VMAQADLFGFPTAERLYHRLLYRTSCNVEQYSAKPARSACYRMRFPVPGTGRQRARRPSHN
jgi:hypothetical protein